MKSINFTSIIAFVFLVMCEYSFGQTGNAMLEITKPNPSVANLMSFADIPVNTHTGIPNIDIPFINLPTINKDCNVGVALSYHPAGNAFTNAASDVGVGWNLIAGGVISRTVTNYPDEYLRNLYQNLGWPVNQIVFDDVYSYNFMGYSGKFKIKYNQLTNTATIEKMEVNNLKIMCAFATNTQSVLSFTLYDDNGLKYIFNIRDRSNALCIDRGYQQNIFNQLSLSPELIGTPLRREFNYPSAYHLAEVYDANNIKLINCSYTNQVIAGLMPNGAHDKVTNKISVIEAVNYGKVFFDFSYFVDPINKLNDPFTLNEILLKNTKNEVISKFDFTYMSLTLKETRRYLSKIDKYDNIFQKKESHNFEYHTEVYNSSPYYCDGTEDFYYGTDKFGYLNLTGNPHFTAEAGQYVTDGMFYEDFNERTSKDYCLYGALKKITFPTGGIKEFEFESNTFRYSQNPNSIIPISQEQYEIENTDNHVYTQIHNAEYSINKGNGFKNIPLVISGTEPVKLFIKLYPVAYYSIVNDPVDAPMYASFQLLGNGDPITLERTTPTCLGQFVALSPGTYTIKATSIENSSGLIVITKKEMTSQPIKAYVYGGGLRIKKISDRNMLNTETPDREVNYEYSMFNNPNMTSGELYDGHYRSFATKRATAAQVSYKNVKIFDTKNNGYTKHTYESYTDTPHFINSIHTGYFPKYFGYKNGLLKKIEVFDRDNNLVQETNNNYELTESGTSMYINSMLDYNFGSFYARPCWTKLVSQHNQEYYYTNSQPSGSIESTTNYTYNNFNLKKAQQTVVNAQNDSFITKYFYANDENNQALLAKNMISNLLKKEEFKNSDKLTTQETTYKDWGTNFITPQIVKTAKGTNPLELEVKYNKVDLTTGNPQEVQQKSGLKTCYIWGYNKTLPVARIDNVAYNTIPPSLITAIETASNGNNEGALLSALSALRTDPVLANTMVTTYTYKPLVGISTVTDPKGDKVMYHYDNFNRLKEVRDKDNNILSENQYKYRTQN